MRLLNILTLLCGATLAQAGIIESIWREKPEAFLARNGAQQETLSDTKDGDSGTSPQSHLPPTLRETLDAIQVMQDTYFDLFTGTWPQAIDWTAAVIGTHVSATLSSIISSVDISSIASCSDLASWQNTIDRYFAHTSIFYFGENAFSLRNQAFDDMLWVVLGWLENIKFVELYSLKHWDFVQSGHGALASDGWHGLQFAPMAAHRARIFYDLASDGWDDSLCGGGMTWNPYLTPYKNAITNELFTAASIAMYLYYPGDNNSSPYMAQSEYEYSKPHNPLHLENAIKSYKWLRESQMNHPDSGLYQDGFHISGWHRYPNGTINPGTGQCDELDPMVYTYNQGVILSASRGLWLATGARSYLADGHSLIDDVIKATGWPNTDATWAGLGRGGVLEEFCDHNGYCSQNGQTFKGIFFHHLSEFCRPLWPQEEAFTSTAGTGFDKDVYQYHLARCSAYSQWISHNAAAALATKDGQGRFGMWWKFEEPNQDMLKLIEESTTLPPGAVDYINPIPEIPEESDYPRKSDMHGSDSNDRGRGRTVETQSGGLSILRAKWNWESHLNQMSA